MTATRILKILFATKLADSNISIYGRPAPIKTITDYKEKIHEEVKNGLLIATVGDYKNVVETADVLKFFQNGIVLFRIADMVEDEFGYYMQVKFEDNEAGKLVWQKIRNGWMPKLFIKQLGNVSLIECFTDQYLAKSMEYKFFIWLRWQISFIDEYYCKHIHYRMLPK